MSEKFKSGLAGGAGTDKSIDSQGVGAATTMNCGGSRCGGETA